MSGPRPPGGGGTGRGRVEALLVAEVGGGAMRSVASVRTVDGLGIEGDRYLLGSGHWSDHRCEPLTLVSAEALEKASREVGRPLAPTDVRRNVVTRGVALDALVGRSFRVGEVTLRGTRPCDPCRYLEELSGIEGLKGALRGRGGLRAVILVDGTIRLDDPVTPLDQKTTKRIVDSRGRRR